MPRQARLDIPGALHHIMVRGINKADIFDERSGQGPIFERLGKNVTEAFRVFNLVLGRSDIG